MIFSLRDWLLALWLVAAACGAVATSTPLVRPPPPPTVLSSFDGLDKAQLRQQAALRGWHTYRHRGVSLLKADLLRWLRQGYVDDLSARGAVAAAGSR